ncbi:hypothetical protein Tco_0155370 [Tanacetum coccineum]
MFDARHQNRYANVAWLIARWMERKGAGTQKESQICCGQFIMKLARKARVLSDEVLRSLSAPMYVGSIQRIQGIGYGVLGFLGVGITLDIFQNLHILYLQYGVLIFSGYGVLSLFPFWSFGECRHGYAVSSLMDTAYYKQKDKDKRITGLAAAGPAELWRCWPHQSSIWCVFRMPQVTSLEKFHRIPRMSAH